MDKRARISPLWEIVYYLDTCIVYLAVRETEYFTEILRNTPPRMRTNAESHSTPLALLRVVLPAHFKRLALHPQTLCWLTASYGSSIIMRAIMSICESDISPSRASRAFAPALLIIYAYDVVLGHALERS